MINAQSLAGVYTGSSLQNKKRKTSAKIAFICDAINNRDNKLLVYDTG